MDSQSVATPVYLIDASIYIFQAHFSPYVECNDRAGNDLSAVYGFTQFLLQFLRRVQPKHAAAAHDESLFCGFRHDLCSDYKSNRELPDENLAMQLRASKEVCSILGLQAFGSKVYEADDIIGVLANSIRGEVGKDRAIVNVITKDKDLAQLLKHENDCLWEFSSNQKRFIKDIEEEFGVSPEQIVDFLALAGDSVDCITGVPGVGPVAARELLQRYADLEAIYDYQAEISGLPIRGAKRLANLLSAHRDQAELSRKLATIICEVNDSTEEFSNTMLQDIAVIAPDLDELRAFLVEYKFASEESERIMKQVKRLSSQNDS